MAVEGSKTPGLKLTDLERTILFDALTLYKKHHELWRTYTPEQTKSAQALEAVRSKLKRVLGSSPPDAPESH